MRKERKERGELEVIRYLRKRFPKRRSEVLRGIGDDAMVLRNGYVVSTDSFFENTHFDLAYFSFYALGYHTMAASLSDLRKYKCDITGGDIVKCQTFGMAITVIGHARKPILRSGAVPGNSLYSTNFLGLAEVGRIALKEKLLANLYPDSIKKHLYPNPRIREAFSLRKYATSCIDLSDGLSTDAYHLAEESNVKIVIDSEHIPVHPEVGKLCGIQGRDPTRFILSSGEDFELLFTAARVPRIPGVKVFRIGRVMKGRGLFLSGEGRMQRLEPSGYEHI